MELTTVTPQGVNLGAANSFQNEASAAQGRLIMFNVTNNTGTNQKVILCPSFKPSDVNRVIRDGAIPFGDGHANKLTAASGNPDVTIADVLSYISKVPTRVLITQMRSTDQSQLSQIINIHTKDIFTNPKLEQINIGAYLSPEYVNEKLISIPRVLHLDYETEVSLIVPGKTDGENAVAVTTSFTFFCGATMNIAEQLYTLAVMNGGAK